MDQVRSLQDAGARYVVVLNLPDIGATINSQRAGAANPDIPAALSDLTRAYNEALDTRISSQEHGIVPVNIFALMDEIIKDPQDYGFTNVDGIACTPGSNPLRPNGGLESIVCGPTDAGYLSPPDPDTNEKYLFADGSHPSGAVHAAVASTVISTLTAPVHDIAWRGRGRRSCEGTP